ncbi:MAG: V/A-type H+-transporting ATPase subunit I [Candidatus Methanophagaceae archaeon]|nr:MAG: V/A-type H+-transporting ATPase subunit I [Methanophagales archaeon]
MRELRIVTLDEHVDGVIKRIDALGSVHLTDIKEFLNVWEGLVVPSKADEMLIKASELLVRIDNLIALLQQPQESKKSLKEMLFQEQEDEKEAGKTEVVGISLEAIDTEFTKLEKRVNELITNKDSLIEDSSKAKELLRVLMVLDDFGVDLGFVGAKDIITVHLGKLPESGLEALAGSLETVVGANYFVESRQVPDGEDEVVFALVVTLTEDKEAVDRVLMRLDFEPWQRPEVELPERIKDAIADVETKIKQQADAIKGTEREVAEIRKTKFADLLAMHEFVQIEDNKAKVKVLFGHSERVRVIEGWTPKKEVENVIAGIRDETGGFFRGRGDRAKARRCTSAVVTEESTDFETVRIYN